MELINQISLDCLTADAVSVGKRTFLIQNGQPPLPVGDVHRAAFVNSSQGRALLQNYEMDENYKLAILAVWGETPTVVEEPPKNEGIPEETPEEGAPLPEPGVPE